MYVDIQNTCVRHTKHMGACVPASVQVGAYPICAQCVLFTEVRHDGPYRRLFKNKIPVTVIVKSPTASGSGGMCLEPQHLEM